MLTDSTKASIHENTIGQGHSRAAMWIDGDWHFVLPTVEAAKFYGLHRTWLAKKCEHGQLIAIKLGGSWWVSIGIAEISVDVSVHDS